MESGKNTQENGALGGPGKGNGQAGGKRRIMDKMRQNPKAMAAVAIVTIIAIIGGLAYLQVLQTRVFIEDCQISAPIISLGPAQAGVIDRYYVNEGERVHKNQILAKIGDEQIKARTDGIVLMIQNTPGQMAGPQDALIKLIDPRELRVVGRLAEDKGLKDVRIGQRVIFTADAFGSQEYEGVVTQIAPTARQADIVFSISDTRQVQDFEVKATFDTDAYPELKNGMSARMWVYK
jgi:multidrug resistance efflux pump